MEEIWKDVPGYEGKYFVSNNGRIKNKNNLILKPYINRGGYSIITFWGNNKANKFQIHQLVAKLFIDNPLNYREVNHKDENKLNNSIENLEWCSHSYNMNYGTIKERISRSNTGKVSKFKGMKRPEISERQLGKPHPHGSTKKKSN